LSDSQQYLITKRVDIFCKTMETMEENFLYAYKSNHVAPHCRSIAIYHKIFREGNEANAGQD